MLKYPISSTSPKISRATTANQLNKITIYKGEIEPNGQIALAEVRDLPASISPNELPPPSS